MARFAVYASTAGDYFFTEIRSLLAHGLRGLGHDAVEAGESRGFIAGVDWHLVVCPQQFFYLGRGQDLRTGPWPAGVILYNTEQRGMDWFPLLERLAPRAHAVWDIAQVPLGFNESCGLFSAGSPMPWGSRPIDVLFAGSRTPRRDAFFRENRGLFRRFRSVLRLVDDDRYLRAARPAARSRALLVLERRSRVVLNLHRSDAPFFEWHRIALHGIGQGALVISEPTTAAPPFKAGRDFVAAPLSRIPAAVEYYLGSEAGRAEAARIAARGLLTYRENCRMEDVLSAALPALGQVRLAAGRPARVFAETAAGLLRLSSPASR